MRAEALERQQGLFGDENPFLSAPPKGQLLKWIGNKQRFASQLISYFPQSFGTYFEPFLGSGAVLATLAPRKAVASDSFAPLMEIRKTLHRNSKLLKQWYSDRWEINAQKISDERAYFGWGSCVGSTTADLLTD